MTTRSHRASWARLAAFATGLALLAGVAALHAQADVVKLKDGTVLEGEVKKMGGSYQIRTKDGQYRLIKAADIESVTTDDLGSGAAGGSGNRPPSSSGSPSPSTSGSGYTQAYYDLKKRIDALDQPVKAVTLWEQHLLRKDISAGERSTAEAELLKWKKLYSDGAEKIKNKWMSGEELKKIKDEANSLVDKAMEQERSGQVLDAIKNYKQAIIIYPNSFRAHYRLGYIKFAEGAGQMGGNTSLRESERHLRAALRLEPELPAVLSSMGAGLFALGKYEEGVEYMWKAVKKAETPLVVGNLLGALNAVPDRWLANNRKLREINLQANYLRQNYKASGLTFIVNHLHGVDTPNEEDKTDKGPPGLVGNGSGFFISPDGYVLTNRHVAETDNAMYYRVRLPEKDKDGLYVEYLARFIAAGAKSDVALLKVDLPEGVAVPYLDLISGDYPAVAAQIMTLGYPVTGLDTYVMQVATGSVKSIVEGEQDGREVWMDLSTTFGNSGGPIVDRNGDVIAILTGARQVANVLYVQGVSVKCIRSFFAEIGEKAPSLSGLGRESDRPFDPEKLAAEARQATLLVLIFRGSLTEDAAGPQTADESAGTAPAAETPP